MKVIWVFKQQIGFGILCPRDCVLLIIWIRVFCAEMIAKDGCSVIIDRFSSPFVSILIFFYMQKCIDIDAD